MSFTDRLEQASKSTKAALWKGTFREFLELIKNGKHKNIDALAHRRLYNMILDAGTERVDFFGRERISYRFFEDYLFGIEDSIDEFMSYLQSAANRADTSKRMLLLVGPPSSGKSDLLIRLKEGLEQYSKTDQGAIFAISGSKMNENPLLLVPNEIRKDFELEYGVQIEGHLSPLSAYRLETEFKGDFLSFPVEQIFLSEQNRIGIGTFLPGDTKSQDFSELVGGIDFAKIQEVGDEADPRSYNFNGELNVANRGIMEFVEGLKCVLPNTRIPTNQGLLRISDIHGHEKEELVAAEHFLKTSNGFERGNIIRSCYKGKEQSLSCITKKGYKLEGSRYHRIMVVDNQDEFKWKNLESLSVGDKLVMTHDGTWPETAPELPVVESKDDNRQHVLFPKRLNSEIARLLGYFTAEGSYSKHKETMYTIRISNYDKEVIEDIYKIAASLNLKAATNDDSNNINSRQLCILFEKLGFDSIKHAKDKFVPEIIFRSPKSLVADFLKSYFSGDGTVSHNKISCTSISEQLIIDIQLLLLNFGIVSSRTKFWNKKYGTFYHYLYISSIHYDRFLAEIGFSVTRKQTTGISRQKTRINHRDFLPVKTSFDRVWSKLLNTAEKTELSIAPKSLTVKQSASHLISRKAYNDIYRFATGNSTASRRSIIGLIEELSPLDCLEKEVQELEQIVNAPIFIDEIEEITDIGLQDVYDVHETTKHSYAAHGFINHNSDERFLRVLLTATQEKAIKAPRFGFISCDCAIILHSNEEEFRSFMSEKKYEPYHDRMVVVKVPYNLAVKNEVKIYEKLLKKTDAKDMHTAPNTLLTAAMFAVMTRLLTPSENSDLSTCKKMKLYDSQSVRGWKKEQVPDIKRKSTNEGMFGISPRFMVDQIAIAIAHARDENRNYITSLDVLRQITKGIHNRDSLSKEKKNQYDSLLEETRKEWDDLLKNDIQKAFFVSYEDEAKNLCENYLDHIEAACSGKKPRDPVTNDEIELDEKLMDSVEQQLEISHSGKDDFRNEILRAVALATRKSKAFDYTQHSQLKEAIQKKLFEERKNVIRMTVSTRNPDTDELKRINDVIAKMQEQQGYTVESANALLKYATSHLFDK